MVELELFWIAVIICFIVDCSGIIDAVKSGISKFILGKYAKLKFRMKPFDCSLCMTFWCGLVYIYLTDNLSLWIIAYICILAHLTPTITQLLYIIQDVIGNILNRLSDKIEQYDSK